jgi:hypothetical protein
MNWPAPITPHRDFRLHHDLDLAQPDAVQQFGFAERLGGIDRRPRAAQAELAQQLSNRGVGERLLDEAEDVEVMRARQRLGGAQHARGFGAEQRNLALITTVGEMAQHLDAVHAGHIEIEQHQVAGKRSSGETVQRGKRRTAVVAALHRADALRAQHGRGHVAHQLHVVDHQHAQAGRIDHGSGGLACVVCG